uniref:Uncharacterized protein n=1 Tax=Caenorhabditis tropicalis TaxID=1561998 RepID=A0A1I7US99_9PELO
MQYISFILIVFFFAGVTIANQDFKIGKFGGVGSGDDSVNFDRYITNKRAINGQLRRSSIHWGKRAPIRSFERDIPLIPEEYLGMWPAPERRIFENEDFFETTTSPPETSSHKSRQQETNLNEEVFSNHRMERVAKAGIRPKLQLSSRLWGR